VTVSCAGGKELFPSDLHTKRSPTQSDIHQRFYWYNWFSWWWTRGCSKHVENLNNYIEENSASSWSFTNNSNGHEHHYTRQHANREWKWVNFFCSGQNVCNMYFRGPWPARRPSALRHLQKRLAVLQRTKPRTKFGLR